jgi:DNA-binding NarL/FixJ family response regulator
VAECRSALAIFERAGAQHAADRTAALLRSLGVTSRSRAGVTNDAGLSRREREVLELLREGLSNAEIGHRLFITSKTAEHHVGAILGKLNLRTRAEAGVFAESQRDR